VHRTAAWSDWPARHTLRSSRALHTPSLPPRSLRACARPTSARITCEAQSGCVISRSCRRKRESAHARGGAMNRWRTCCARRMTCRGLPPPDPRWQPARQHGGRVCCRARHVGGGTAREGRRVCADECVPAADPARARAYCTHAGGTTHNEPLPWHACFGRRGAFSVAQCKAADHQCVGKVERPHRTTSHRTPGARQTLPSPSSTTSSPTASRRGSIRIYSSRAIQRCRSPRSPGF